MEKDKSILFGRQSAAVLVVLLLLTAAGPALAMGVVLGRYTVRTATELRLEIEIGTPTPTSLILVQHLPAGTRVASAEPAYKKFNQKTGEVRWLIRHPRPGTLTVTIFLAGPPINPAQAHAEIRCMDPKTGELMTTKIE